VRERINQIRAMRIIRANELRLMLVIVVVKLRREEGKRKKEEGRREGLRVVRIELRGARKSWGKKEMLTITAMIRYWGKSIKRETSWGGCVRGFLGFPRKIVPKVFVKVNNDKPPMMLRPAKVRIIRLVWLRLLDFRPSIRPL
jgi:hypothetical protein